jgi:hypothetical protein
MLFIWDVASDGATYITMDANDIIKIYEFTL